MDLISREKAIEISKTCYRVAESMEELGVAYEDNLKDMPSTFEGMTNRDVLKALFPIDENKGTRFTKVYLDHEAIESFELLTTQKWLDSPYKGVRE